MDNNSSSSDEEYDFVPLKKRHIPKPRPVEELFAEDEKAADLYAGLTNLDDDIDYEGFEGDVARIETWEDAELHPQILQNLKERSKYIRPRKIQSAAFPFIFDGFDVKVQAETGSGKTLTYLLPIIDKVIREKLEDSYCPKPVSPYAIIIGPTRELVLQIYEQAKKFCYRTDVKVAKAYGEYDIPENLLEITYGCDILVATPGRLKHFILGRQINVKRVKCLVLDEADRLLARGQNRLTSFMPDLKDIVRFRHFPSIGDRQTLLFSATFLPEVMRNADKFVQPDAAFITNNKNNPNKRIIQDFIFVQSETEKFEKVAMLLAAEIEQVGGDPKKLRHTIVFVNSRLRSNYVAEFLQGRGIHAVAINADRTQDLREEAFNDFRERKINLLVASDVCARGLDIKDLDHIINMDMPWDMPTYLYRIGRTGRITQGFATSFISTQDGIIHEIVQRMKEGNERILPALMDMIEQISTQPRKEASSSSYTSSVISSYRSTEDISTAASVREDVNDKDDEDGNLGFESMKINDF